MIAANEQAVTPIAPQVVYRPVVSHARGKQQDVVTVQRSMLSELLAALSMASLIAIGVFVAMSPNMSVLSVALLGALPMTGIAIAAMIDRIRLGRAVQRSNAALMTHAEPLPMHHPIALGPGYISVT